MPPVREGEYLTAATRFYDGAVWVAEMGTLVGGTLAMRDAAKAKAASAAAESNVASKASTAPKASAPAPEPTAAPASTQSTLTSAAQRAHSTVGTGRGPVHGTRVHSAFEAEVRALGRTDLTPEVSYLNGDVVRRGTAGSIRVDVVEGPLGAPMAVYDLKTGSATLTPQRIAEIRTHLPNGGRLPDGSLVPVIEIR